MQDELQDARKLTHGAYEDVIVVEYRNRNGATDAPQIVLELQDGSRVIDRSTRFEVDGALGALPAVGKAYRVLVGPAPRPSGHADDTGGGSLRYESKR